MNPLPPDADKRGYLLEDFRLFHLKESRAQRFSYHYHEFDKVVVFLSGQVTYTVEGKAYFLSPGDLLLVPHHHIHQPDIGGATYERYILWLAPEFLSANGLEPCFVRAAQSGFHLIRPGEERTRLLLEKLDEAEKEDAEAGKKNAERATEAEKKASEVGKEGAEASEIRRIILETSIFRGESIRQVENNASV